MRKTLVVIGLIITFLILYFLQVNIFSVFTIAGISPNLFVIFILCIGLFANQTLGISLGIICGLVLDLLYGKTIGVSAAMYCIIGYLGAYFDRNFSKENKLTIMIMIIAATGIFEIGSYYLNAFILDFNTEFFKFLKILFIEILYNVLLVIIIYPVIQKLGFAIDRTFKKNNILTRYF